MKICLKLCLSDKYSPTMGELKSLLKFCNKM